MAVEEVWGVIYERFSVAKKLEHLSSKYNIKTVLEIPAHGEKAMPSIYSLGFGKHVESLTLLNGNEKYRSEWETIHCADKTHWLHVDNLEHTGLPANSYDFVWNFAYIPKADDPNAMIEEMKRLSKKYVAVFSVNAGNIGFPIHRLVHKKTQIPWTHGDIRWNNRKFIKKQMESHGMKVIEQGFVDCPVWPDSIGFRDVRLHRMNIDFNLMDWKSDFPQMLDQNKYPKWVWFVYMIEKLPMPRFLKSVHAHINYTIAEIK